MNFQDTSKFTAGFAGDEPDVEDNAQSLCDRLEQFYSFTCEAGPLANCIEWRLLREQIDTATAEIGKVLKEFDTAGKPQGYVGRLNAVAAFAALTAGDRA